MKTAQETAVNPNGCGVFNANRQNEFVLSHEDSIQWLSATIISHHMATIEWKTIHSFI